MERLFLHFRNYLPANKVLDEDAVLGNADESDLLSVLLDPALHDWVRPFLFHHANEFKYLNIQKVSWGPLSVTLRFFNRGGQLGPCVRNVLLF